MAILTVAVLCGACRIGYDRLGLEQGTDAAADDAGNIDASPAARDAEVDALPPDANSACATSTCGDTLCCPEVNETNANCPQDCLAMATCGICTNPTATSCTGGACDLTCAQPGCDYTVDCTAATDCRVNCDNGSDCSVDCNGASDCDVRCEDTGTTCFTDCTNATVCDAPRCRNGASCLLDCTGANTCAYDDCEGGQTSCPNNILACNRACP